MSPVRSGTIKKSYLYPRIVENHLPRANNSLPIVCSMGRSTREFITFIFTRFDRPPSRKLDFYCLASFLLARKLPVTFANQTARIFVAAGKIAFVYLDWLVVVQTILDSMDSANERTWRQAPNHFTTDFFDTPAAFTAWLHVMPEYSYNQTCCKMLDCFSWRRDEDDTKIIGRRQRTIDWTSRSRTSPNRYILFCCSRINVPNSNPLVARHFGSHKNKS